MTRFIVAVPATLSNLGPGYDVLGLALTLQNRFEFTVLEGKKRFCSGGKEIAAKNHLSFKTFLDAIDTFGGEFSEGLQLEQEEKIPRSRGLGSSATARIAGLSAYLRLVNDQVSVNEQLEFLAKGEGHPDNVTPALLGGLSLCGSEQGRSQQMTLPAPNLRVALCIPHKTVATNEARKILPKQYSGEEVVYSTSRIAFLIASLLEEQHQNLRFAMQDCIHQPYRKRLIGNVDEAFSNAYETGALSAFISGSGSTLAAFVAMDQDASLVASAMQKAFGEDSCQALSVETSSTGVVVSDA
ncbi:MAG: homoserine kinase [Myxococcota bacterium]|nr:homoserine kinase [Myxococcota bacterium]